MLSPGLRSRSLRGWSHVADPIPMRSRMPSRASCAGCSRNPLWCWAGPHRSTTRCWAGSRQLRGDIPSRIREAPTATRSRPPSPRRTSPQAPTPFSSPRARSSPTLSRVHRPLSCTRGPMLLVTSSRIPRRHPRRATRLKPRTIVIPGGPNSVGSGVATAFRPTCARERSHGGGPWVCSPSVPVQVR